MTGVKGFKILCSYLWMARAAVFCIGCDWLKDFAFLVLPCSKSAYSGEAEGLMLSHSHACAHTLNGIVSTAAFDNVIMAG